MTLVYIMRYSKFIYSFMLISVVLLSCRKSRQERYPVVRIISVDHDTANETLSLVGEIVNDGGEEIESAGFDVSATPDFNRSYNLCLAELDGNRFEYTYYFEETESTYSPLISQNKVYVHAYAVNKNGFGVSEVQVSN